MKSNVLRASAAEFLYRGSSVTSPSVVGAWGGA